jgi:uncharacterized protein YndB with AHSA1/START domain
MSSVHEAGEPSPTAAFHIEREVMIDAPVEIVWRTISEPEQIQRWFADRVELVLEPGGPGAMGFEDRAFPLVVEVVEPPTHFSFRWNHPAGEVPAAGNSTLVEFTLASDGDRTRLRVVESGLELLAWPASDKARFADEHRGGWAMFLDRLTGLFADHPPHDAAVRR